MEVHGKTTDRGKKRPGFRRLLIVALVFGTLGAVYSGALLVMVWLEALGD